MSESSAHPLLAAAHGLSPKLTELRHLLHQYPEIAYEEVGTSARCSAAMSELGYLIRPGFARTGFLAEMGESGPLILIRTDLDGLPIQETSTVPYASCIANRMHACGHDGHMASVVGAAHLLAARHATGQMPGRVRFLFQPAEESGGKERRSGASRMVEEGALEDASAVIAQHYMPDLPLGQVAILDGPVMAAASPFQISIRGDGGHIAQPERVIDTILAGSLLRVAVKQGKTARGMTDERAIIGFGTFQSSSQATNVVPKLVILKGSIRSFSLSDQSACKSILTEAFGEALHACNADGDIDYLGDLPVTSNDPVTAAVMREAVLAVLGGDSIVQTPPRFAAEDFAHYGHGTSVPTAFMLTGTGEPGKTRELHTSDYDLPDEVLPMGAAILAETALRLMRQC